MKKLAVIAFLFCGQVFALPCEVRGDTPEPAVVTAARPVVTLPAEESGKTGAWIIVPITNMTAGADVLWYLPDAKKSDKTPAHRMADADSREGLAEVPLGSRFGDEWAKAAKGRVFTSDVAGQFRVCAYCAKGDKASLIATCVVTVVSPTPPVPPVPPVPPTPPPVPPGPAPIPGDGLRVLIVYESADLSKLPKDQLNVLYSQSVRGYLDTHCAKGADGKTPEWRVWDQNVPTGAEAKAWQDAMARKRDTLPWLIVSNGKSGYEGPLPPNTDAMLRTLQTYGGQ